MHGCLCAKLMWFFSKTPKGTFDVEPQNFEMISLRQIPHLSSLTMCLWLRFLEKKGEDLWFMAEYRVPGSRNQHLRLMWVKYYDHMELLVNQLAWTGASHFVTERY